MARRSRDPRSPLARIMGMRNSSAMRPCMASARFLEANYAVITATLRCSPSPSIDVCRTEPSTR